MDNKIYLIIKHDFDNLENHQPHYEEILGYAETLSGATASVKTLEITTPKYKGWDKETYPKFAIKPVSKY